MFKGTGDTSQLGGPIKIAKISGQVAKLGFIAFLSIMAYISISLGFINLFPIPMLDGGHLMFYAFEKILGRPLTQRTQEGFFRIGLFLILSLMFFTTFNDLKDAPQDPTLQCCPLAWASCSSSKGTGGDGPALGAT